MNEEAAPPLELHGISKSFGGVAALRNVDFVLRRGEIHGLVGENGAGKSTLMKIIAGLHSQYEGGMAIDGRPVGFRSPREALAAGSAAGVFVSEDGGATWILETNGLTNPDVFALTYLGNGTLLAGTNGGSVFERSVTAPRAAVSRAGTTPPGPRLRSRGPRLHSSRKRMATISSASSGRHGSAHAASATARMTSAPKSRSPMTTRSSLSSPIANCAA